LNLSSADSSGLSKSVSAATVGRFLWAKLVYSLQGVSSIPASSWTVYYRAWTSDLGSTCSAQTDILIRRSDGTIRSTINTGVANSASLNTTEQTLSATYSWTAYNVVNQTDYLEIDYSIIRKECSSFIPATTLCLVTQSLKPVSTESNYISLPVTSFFTIISWLQ